MISAGGRYDRVTFDVDAVAGFEAVNVAVDFVVAQGVKDRMQEGGLPRPVFALQHDERMREVHNHRHVEIQIGEYGVAQDLQVHSV